MLPGGNTPSTKYRFAEKFSTVFVLFAVGDVLCVCDVGWGMKVQWKRKNVDIWFVSGMEPGPGPGWTIWQFVLLILFIQLLFSVNCYGKLIDWWPHLGRLDSWTNLNTNFSTSHSTTKQFYYKILIIRFARTFVVGFWNLYFSMEKIAEMKENNHCWRWILIR